MDRKAVIERVRQLVALAGSPFEEEARTSAHLACKLIREHKLGLSFDKDEVPHAPAPPHREPHHAHPSPPRHEASEPWGDPGEGQPVLCYARETLRCCACGSIYGAGERIWWLRGVGGTHHRCGGGVLVEAWRMATAWDPRNVR